MKDYKAVIFDLDGTLIDTIGDIAVSMNRVLKSLDLPLHTIEEYNTYVGSGTKVLSKRVLHEELQTESFILKINKLFAEDYKDNWKEKSKPYPGTRELLEYLQTNKKKIAVLSNKPDEFCQVMTDYFFPTISFDIVRGNMESVPRKPDPTAGNMIVDFLQVKPEEVYYVGDTDIDMKTAINCGFTSIGCGWGFRTKDELIKAGADLTFSQPLDILDYLRSDNES